MTRSAAIVTSAVVVPAGLTGVGLLIGGLGMGCPCAGAIYALWRNSLDATLVFAMMFGLSPLVMLAAVWVAFRVRPAVAGQPRHLPTPAGRGSRSTDSEPGP